MQYKVRLGNTINFKWPILTNGKPEPLEGRELTLIVTDPLGVQMKLDYYVEDNYLITSLLGRDQTTIGVYKFALWENKGKASQRVVDLCAPFVVVRDTHEENIEHGVANTMPSGELFTAIKGDTGKDGLSAYEIAVKNGFEGSEKEWLESLKGNFTDIEHSVVQGSEKPVSSNAVYEALKNYQQVKSLDVSITAPKKSLPGTKNLVYYQLLYKGTKVHPTKLDVEIGKGNWVSVKDLEQGYFEVSGVTYPVVINMEFTYGEESLEKTITIDSGFPIYYSVVDLDFVPEAEVIQRFEATTLPLITTITAFNKKFCIAVPQEEELKGVFDDNDLCITAQFEQSDLQIGGVPYNVLLLKNPIFVEDYGINLQGNDNSAVYNLITNRLLALEEDPIIWTDEATR
nr:MAG TPA: tail sheath protein [Caudoviricetes sp.]